MTLYENIPISHQGRNFEIRVMFDESSVTVLAFLNRHPASGFRYQIKFARHINPEKALDSDAVRHLIELCRDDIITDRWETLISSLA